MQFVLAVIPNKMRPRGTRFYGGTILVVRTTGVGVFPKERAKGRWYLGLDTRDKGPYTPPEKMIDSIHVAT